MNITLSIRGERKKVKGKSFSSILAQEGINPSEYVFMKGHEIILEDETLKEGDEVRLLPVVSGG